MEELTEKEFIEALKNISRKNFELPPGQKRVLLIAKEPIDDYNFGNPHQIENLDEYE